MVVAARGGSSSTAYTSTCFLRTHCLDRPRTSREEALPRLFALGHRWALESAEPMQVRVVTPGSIPDLAGSLVVAHRPALVACQLHALAGRRGDGLAKRESDAADLVRLITELVRADGVAIGATFVRELGGRRD